ncbi:NAD(P)H-dependent oxidoreductase [Acinetobacter baumannii]|uniref:FMN-dependent NADH-azoreductase n=1 Tax=Acinetobacter baumannii TaxID=470 RepID=UPI0002BC71E3|nr:NAD(P)H-dependent oxidoreductase [Acinetobacter baumannii]ANC35340.1 FMN-dependent NADH-azoreductase [Acinetobacter baumannii]AXX40249.1 FMN-dependent NADH-azoreductase [Acinetobacter baumannii]EKT8001760.1 NAD(P)H-dependent oxidoreductase [Acinetobacter baumannii]EKU1731202.1 NAD(P)H-dependent oxidoreductase [Acinetobacter baumannii]EKV2312016.1 NAD(P)H-dependent oxidoreductase [Acinetobacter baumannii]
MKLLQIDTSILGEQSVSRQLTSSVIRQLSTAYTDVEIIHHDFALEPIPHLSDAEFLAWQGVEPNNETAQQRVARNTQYLDEFLSSDIVVIGAPMYNFSFPSQLKAWLDRLSVAGKTFRYTENGPQGLVEGKRVIIASSRGGVYSEGSPAEALDYQETYIKAFFNFIGVTDITFVRAEGIAFGPEARQAALDNAAAQIAQLAG